MPIGRLGRCLLASLLLVSGCAAPRLADATTSSQVAAASQHSQVRARWQDEIIYFALLDRFQNGDRSNDFDVNRSNPTAYHGGDLQGLIDKLGYLSDLGVTALWVSPVLDNDDRELNRTGLWGFHGYWTKNFSKIDEHLGTTAKMQELVQKAHARGLKVLLDVVCNHAGYEFPKADPRYAGYFHANGDIQNWDDPWQSVNCSIYGLPDFAQERPEVSKFLIDTYVGWATTLGLDGFRVDALKHVPMSFWSQFTAAAHARLGPTFLTLGEMLNGDPDVCAPYQRQGGFDSVFDFPLYFTFDEVFAKGGSMRKLGERFAQDGRYPDATMLSPFLDNHDMPRFLSQAGGDQSKLRLALAALMTVRGFPMLYYGTEVGMTGAGEPDNRADMAWGANASLHDYVKTLIAARKRSSALMHGRQLEMWQDDQVYAYLRQSPEAEAIVALNNDRGTQTRSIPLRAESRLGDGTVLVDALTGEKFTVQGRRLTLPLAGKQARILMPAGNR